MHYVLILLVAASRFLPHPPNVACIGALGLFAGCYLAGRRAYLIPVAALLISDVIGHLLAFPGMGFYSLTTMVAVYVGAMAAVPIGRLMKNAKGMWKFPAGSLAASTAFFVVSNFGVWLGPWYANTLSGLAACYTAAIPFFGYTIAGDLAFTVVLFGVWEMSRRTALAPAHQPRQLSSVEA
ncbi:MAG: DUF6580 family putative transport protein [Pirellulaceae bacterium]